jgi:hypothetical protein
MLPHLTVTRISKTKRLKAYLYNILGLLFNKELYYGEYVRQFFFSLYILLEIYAFYSNCLLKDASFRHKPVKIANREPGRWAFISEL